MYRTAVLVAMLSAACGSPSREPPDYPGVDRSVELAQEFDLAVGESVTVHGTRLLLSFHGVPEDSRCPMNARCVWAGNAKVDLNVVGSKPAEEGMTEVHDYPFVLNTNDRFDTTYRFWNYEISLIRLEPTPMAGEKIENYVATLRVEARP